MKHMTLIRFRPEYHESVLALHRSSMNGFATGMTQQQEEADLLAIEQAYLAGGGEFLVGILDGRVVAMGGFKRVSKTTAELRRMRIEQSRQDKGYGTQLLGELERRACECGVRLLSLETAKARPLTLKFYRKRGYEETGAGHYGAVETIRFAKRLGRMDGEEVC